MRKGVTQCRQTLPTLLDSLSIPGLRLMLGPTQVGMGLPSSNSGSLAASTHTATMEILSVPNILQLGPGLELEPHHRTNPRTNPTPDSTPITNSAPHRWDLNQGHLLPPTPLMESPQSSAHPPKCITSLDGGDRQILIHHSVSPHPLSQVLLPPKARLGPSP